MSETPQLLQSVELPPDMRDLIIQFCQRMNEITQEPYIQPGDLVHIHLLLTQDWGIRGIQVQPMSMSDPLSDFYEDIDGGPTAADIDY